MYCHLCGASVPEDADRCPECGVDLDADIGSQSGEESPERASDDAHGKSDRPETGEDSPDTASHPSASTASGADVSSDDEQAWDASAPSDVGDHPSGGQQGAQPRHASPLETVDAESTADRPAQASQSTWESTAAHLGGFDAAAVFEGLPVVAGVVTGIAAGFVMFALGWLIAVASPSITDVSTLGLGALVTMDLQFATSGRAATILFTDFQTADPPDATLGFLYLIAPVLLYQVSKLVVDFGIEGRVSLPEGALSGMTVVLGYLPVVLVVGLVVPSSTAPGLSTASEFSLVTGLILAGLCYPLLFGAIGGLSAAYYTPGQRRVGLLYGISSFVVGLIGAFVATWLFIDAAAFELGVVDRLLVSIGAFVQVHTMSAVGPLPSVNLLVPFGLVVLVIAAMGYLRVWRSADVESPVVAVTRAMTPAITYTVAVALLASITMLLADPWVQQELGLGSGSTAPAGFVFGSVATMFPELLARGPFLSIGSYVTVAGLTVLLLVIFLGGTGGLVAWAVETYVLSAE
ncbi:MAG: hypothetical protein ABEI98_03225 [Halorhabdus sp.]